MRITNGSSRAVTYDIRGGALRMSLSTCELEPGEEELWTSRYRVDIGEVELVITWGDDGKLVTLVGADARVRVEDEADGVRIALG
jgi:hypothetical protein